MRCITTVIQWIVRVSVGASPSLGLISLSLGIEPARAAVSEDLRSLPLQRPITYDATIDRTQWLEIWEDDSLAAYAREDFADVRVARESGEVVPIVVRQPRLHEETLVSWMSVPIVWEPGEGGVSLFELGFETIPRERIVAAITPLAAEAVIEIQSSAPGSEWTAVDSRTLPQPGLGLDDVTKGSVMDKGLIDIGPLVRSRLRFVLAEPEHAGDGMTLTLFRRTTRDTPRESVPFRVVSQEFSGRTWQSIVEIQGAARALCGVEFAPDPSLPFRRVRIETKTSNDLWRQARPENDLATSPSLFFDPDRARLVRVSVEGADPPNVPVEIARVWCTPLRLALPTPPAGQRLTLAYGDPFLAPPPWAPPEEFDLVNEFQRAKLGNPEPNPYYRRPSAGLESLRRHPEILTITMLTLLALFGWLVFRWRDGGSAGQGEA
jgi:hypothetical protein